MPWPKNIVSCSTLRTSGYTNLRPQGGTREGKDDGDEEEVDEEGDEEEDDDDDEVRRRSRTR